MRELAKLYYSTGDAASALAHANELRVDSTLAAGTVLALPARLMAYGGTSERAEMSTVVDMVLYERRKDLVFVEVRESVYPGTARNEVAIAGKWLYVVSDGAVVVRVEAGAATDWDMDNQLFGGRRTVVDQTLPLLAGRDYAFFLAPHRLSAGAEDYLLAHVEECLTAGSLVAPNRDTKVLVRDAYEWALDLNNKHYLPKLRAWQTWLADEDRASRLFIASTLKCLIEQKDVGWLWDGTDPLGIQDQLRDGEPNHYIEKVYLEQERKPRTEAEHAMASLAEMLDSVDFRAIENSALEEGGDALRAGVLEWACVLPGIMQTQPGRELAARLVADETRIPLALILTEDPSGTSLEFSQARYLQSAAFAIVKDLAPSWVALHRARNQINPLEYLKAFLERLSDEKLELRGTLRQMHRNLQAGRPLTRKLKNPQRVRQKLFVKSGLAAALVAAEPPAGLLKGDRFSRAFSRNFNTAQLGIRGVVEVVNLANTLGELQVEASARKIMSAVGAIADGGALLGEILGEAMEVVLKESSMTALKSGALGLGFISGVCDCIEFGIVAHEATAKHDYNAAVGHAVASVGASIIALSAAGAMGATLLGAAQTAWVAAVVPAAIIGVALVGTGALVARLCVDNSYEEFAKLCFLGKAHGGRQQDWDWSSHPLPAKSAKTQADALGELMATYRVALEDDTGVTIYPGYYEEGDTFEVYVDHADESHPRSAYLEACPHSGNIMQLQGEPLAVRSHVSFDETGRAQKIWICEILDRLGPHELRVTRSRLVQVRLRRANKTYVPVTRKSVPSPRCTEVELRFGSFGPDRRAASSSRYDHQAPLKYTSLVKPTEAGRNVTGEAR